MALGLIALVALIPLTPASAAAVNPDQYVPDVDEIIFYSIDPDIEYSPEGCEECYVFSIHVHLGLSNCFDCPVYVVDVEVRDEDDGEGAKVNIIACYSSYRWICPVDILWDFIGPIIIWPDL